MQNYINNLQAKPEHVKRRILVVGTAVSMAVIIGIWILSLFFGNGVFAPKSTEVTVTDTTPGPMTLIKDFFTKITGGTIPLPPTSTSNTTTLDTNTTNTVPGMPQSYTATPTTNSDTTTSSQ